MSEILHKLEWPYLLQQISRHARTEAGQAQCLEIAPDLDRSSIQARWHELESLRDLLEAGYTPPLGELPPVEGFAAYARREGILEVEQLWQVLCLAEVVNDVKNFARDFASRSVVLKRLSTTLDPLPALTSALQQALTPKGKLSDTASPKLAEIRRRIVQHRHKIESMLTEIFQRKDYVKYLQDTFFTIRMDRYVLPIKLDGHGRIKGKVYDTSQSDQTLFMEPVEVAELNDQLVNLELDHKLEVMRILRELSKLVTKHIDAIMLNYRELVSFDVLWAMASVAREMQAIAPVMSATETICLRQARHPNLVLRMGDKVVANDIFLEKDQQFLILSGPNAGGKTVVLKTVGLLQLMLKAGMLLPVGEDSEVYPFEDFFVEVGDSQNLEADLSTFAGHLNGLKAAIDGCQKDSLILLDEIAVGTDSEIGSALGKSILEELAARGGTGVVTTHYAKLKLLGLEDKRFRSGAMQFEGEKCRPNYKLTMDLPGESLGIELAEQMNLPKTVTQRARSILGEANNFEKVISELNERQRSMSEREELLQKELIETQAERGKWRQELEILQKDKEELKSKLAKRYNREFEDWQSSYHALMTEVKKNISDIKERQKLQTQFQEMGEHFKSVQNSIDELQADPLEDYVPVAEPRIGQEVFIGSLNTTGVIQKISHKHCVVTVGELSVQVPVADLFQHKG